MAFPYANGFLWPHLSLDARVSRWAFLLLALLIRVPSITAQTWSVGLTTGIVATEDFDGTVALYAAGSSSPDTLYTPISSRLLIGPTVGLQLGSAVRFEAGALRKDLEFDFVSITGRPEIARTEYHTRAAAWQFPLVFQYARSTGRTIPFLSAGASVRRISGVKQTGQTCTQLPTLVCTPFERRDATELENPTTGGVVVGGGIEFGSAHFRLSPEVRFTRWLSRPFTAPLTNPNQLEILFRVAYRSGPDGSRR